MMPLFFRFVPRNILPMDEFLGLNARRYLNPGKSLRLVCELIALWERQGQRDKDRETRTERQRQRDKDRETRTERQGHRQREREREERERETEERSGEEENDSSASNIISSHRLG